MIYVENKIEYVLRMTQLYIYFIIIILLLATSLDLKRPSSGQYLQKKKLKMSVILVQKRKFCGIPFTFISSLYNYYQPLDMPSVISRVEILYCEYYGCISKIFLTDKLIIQNYE